MAILKQGALSQDKRRGWVLRGQCPSCETRLRCTQTEIEACHDTCPECGTVFDIPIGFADAIRNKERQEQQARDAIELEKKVRDEQANQAAEARAAEVKKIEAARANLVAKAAAERLAAEDRAARGVAKDEINRAFRSTVLLGAFCRAEVSQGQQYPQLMLYLNLLNFLTGIMFIFGIIIVVFAVFFIYASYRLTDGGKWIVFLFGLFSAGILGFLRLMILAGVQFFKVQLSMEKSVRELAGVVSVLVMHELREEAE